MYEWPECSENLAWKTCALKSNFKLPKKAFELYKSASVHSQAARGKSWMPAITGGLVVLFFVLAGLVYRTISSKVSPEEDIAARPPGGVAAPAAPAARPGAPPAVAPGRRAWPVYESEPVAYKPRDPYIGRALQLEGQWSHGDQIGAVFGLLVDGERVATVTLAQVVAMGYAWIYLGPCAGVLRHGDTDRLITCGKRAEPERRQERRREPETGRSDPAPVSALPSLL